MTFVSMPYAVTEGPAFKRACPCFRALLWYFKEFLNKGPTFSFCIGFGQSWSWFLLCLTYVCSRWPNKYHNRVWLLVLFYQSIIVLFILVFRGKVLNPCLQSLNKYLSLKDWKIVSPVSLLLIKCNRWGNK